ncbi:hypothetical protein ACFOD0_02830 [Shewanella intestini]|uniref:Uncharacterized protein n=1 Tax=Shewanella intestini TaxID=2017544 RepID=A0ABS5I1M3_9GAMM|nr:MULTISPECIES: hypothetical protein [Shewanella]MBR9727933.1 hypothetical protein [Shewanella intestini]MRG36516.1 hypothetical protein [Shewanella sp. XMDDZSB0408]
MICGLFVSDSSFSEDGLLALGKGKSLVYGLDICEMLQRKLPLQAVLSMTVCCAAETGKRFPWLSEFLSWIMTKS